MTPTSASPKLWPYAPEAYSSAAMLRQIENMNACLHNDAPSNQEIAYRRYKRDEFTVVILTPVSMDGPQRP